MTFSQWLLVLGTLLLVLALASAYLRLLPVSSSVLYLLFGLGVGPIGLGLWQQDIGDISHWLEHLAESAVLISLFIGGLKLRLPLRAPEWRTAYLLAAPVLVGTIFGLTLIGHSLLDMSWGLALLVAAILSPTDPVLASLVQVSGAGDVDRLRYSISGEAGLNDGVAFPFVIAGIMLLQFESPNANEWLFWFAKDVLWAVPAALLLGYLLGRGTGRLVIYLRARHNDTVVSANDFLALALIAISYACAETIGAWGFLATFCAGVGLRHAEVDTSGHDAVPAEEAASGTLREEGQAAPVVEFGSNPGEHPQIAAGAVMADILSFGGLLERLLEVFMVTLLGALLVQHWDWRALPLGLALFCLVRPAMVVLLVRERLLPLRQRLFVGWFGIRGIGSLYYLSYAVNHDLPPLSGREAIDLVLSVVALSILLHGLTTQPLLGRYERRQ